MSEGDIDQSEDGELVIPEDIGAPDIYTLEIPSDQYQDVTRWDSGKLEIEQTPEQREAFLDWIEDYLEAHR